jgi:Molecular chaperone (small heat shock protein)
MVIDFNSLYDMPKEMDRIFEVFRNSNVMQRRYVYPLVNVAETDDSYVVDACVSGVSPDEVELTLTARSLVIKGERKSPEGRYFRQERMAGAFQRVITLNVPVDRDKVKAKAANGILRITLPKAEEIKPRRISIEQ